MAHHFPTAISDEKRRRIARLGALFILFATIVMPLFLVLLRR